MRDVLVGIDLGTSSVKVAVVDRGGVELAVAQMRYDVDRPHSGWAEQDTETWWTATAQAVRAALGAGDFAVRSVGLSGQMHGLVLVDHRGAPLRPAIIWSDTRSTEQVSAWHATIDSREVEAISGFPTATGMLGVSLSWVRDNEPGVYERAHAALLPKDYIRFRLTGLLATEPTDASGSLLYDIRAGGPATRLMHSLSLDPALFPEVVPTLSIVGGVTHDASARTGLPVGTPVAAGGADQAMAAIALGLDDPGRAAVAISSGGTVFKRTARPLDPAIGLHVMPHAVAGDWMAMGVVLAAGLSLDWVTRKLFGQEPTPDRLAALMADAAEVPAGADGLVFSTRLAGVRTPRVDDAVRGSMIGLGFEHGQAHVTRALVEGVCVELAQSIESMADAGEAVHELVISGGGARFPLWRQTLSDVAGLPVRVSSDVEHSALGAAFAGALATGDGIDVDLAARVSSVVYPDARNSALYRARAHDLQTLSDTVGTSGTRKEPEQMSLVTSSRIERESGA